MTVNENKTQTAAISDSRPFANGSGNEPVISEEQMFFDRITNRLRQLPPCIVPAFKPKIKKRLNAKQANIIVSAFADEDCFFEFCKVVEHITTRVNIDVLQSRYVDKDSKEYRIAARIFTAFNNFTGNICELLP